MAYVTQDPYGMAPDAQMASPPVNLGDTPDPNSQPLWAKGLGDINTNPLSVYVGYQGFRGARTITHGGWSGITGDSSKTRIVDRLNPQSFIRFKNSEEFKHEGFINKMFRNTEKEKSGIIGRRLEGEGRLGDWAAEKGLTNNGITNPIWSRNLLARTTAARRSGRNYTPEIGKNAGDWISHTASDMVEHFARSDMLGRLQANIGGGAMAPVVGGSFAPSTGGMVFESGSEAEMATMMAGKGTVSQWLSGAMSDKTAMTERLEDFGMRERDIFMKGREWSARVRANREGGIKEMWKRAQAQAVEKNAAKSTVEEGVEKAATTGAKEVGETAAKTALETAGKEVAEEAVTKGATAIFAKFGMDALAQIGIDAIPAVGEIWAPISAAIMAYQAAKMTFTLAKDLVIDPVTNAVHQGFNSFKGQIDKSPFGMGYKDNSVAATSRARGVQAIQNSRLNARSILGSEAQYLHSHFG